MNQMITLEDLRRKLEALEAERTRIGGEDLLFDCWLTQSGAGGTARSKNRYWQLRSSIAQFNGKKSKYIKASEASEVAAAIARGRHIRELDKNIAELRQRLAKIERLLSET